jgi:uncharacterized SAM-binding protein YcdF (DUF218 family)
MGAQAEQLPPARNGARRAAVFVTTVLTAIMAVNGAAGYIVFSNATDDALSHVDAVVVLGGEHDGREAYGMALARDGLASTVVLSNPYPVADELMGRMCMRRSGAIEVICLRPKPSTTRGEAIMTRRLARERNWKKILVVTWRYHLPRAGLVFRQCLSGIDVSTSVKAVPREYILPIWYWQYIYLYQFAGIGKVLLADGC